MSGKVGSGPGGHHNNTDPGSAGIVQHYRAKGYRGQELRRVIGRHVRLLTPLDPDAASPLESAWLSDGIRERHLAEQRACRAAWRSRQKRMQDKE